MNEPARMPDPERADVELYNSYVDSVELVGVETVELHAQRIELGDVTQINFEFEAGLLPGEGAVRYRYTTTASARDAGEREISRIKAVVDLVTTSEIPADDDVLARFGATSGTMIAHPYLRQLLSDGASRLGLANVTLPMIKQHAAKADTSTPSAPDHTLDA